MHQSTPEPLPPYWGRLPDLYVAYHTVKFLIKELYEITKYINRSRFIYNINSHIHITLSSLDLWTDPVEVASFCSHWRPHGWSQIEQGS